MRYNGIHPTLSHLCRTPAISRIVVIDAKKYFTSGFDGNGITFNIIAAELINSLLQDNKNKNPDFFSFDS